jgi:flavin reductase (DIM6/NTAB) family NADH-FMN oxidoreductase RutF
LAPYSFFNIFSSNPPIAVFSSNRRVSNNTTKDTLHNIRTTREAVINVVSHNIVRQMAVSSVEWPSETSEFDKTGLTPIPSDEIRPFRVKESPAHLECKLKEIITLGTHGGAGHLIICDIVKLHISEDVIDENDRINPHKMDLMGRMGRAYYTRASGNAVQTIVQAVTQIPVGYDALPASIRNSTVLTGNNIGLLAGMRFFPETKEAAMLKETDARVKEILSTSDAFEKLHVYAHEELEKLNTDFAAQILLVADAL